MWEIFYNIRQDNENLEIYEDFILRSEALERAQKMSTAHKCTVKMYYNGGLKYKLKDGALIY